ncbi:Membrane protein, suppressor for copper-sensitivity ScsD [hydrothermal vent metagenome]|uniref:Membrane protein, suppressor for copper-sensitivity ScsD n=1 Tax=hydrothermal vent metagenome TaxID=652676 RepID=A0A1W1EKE6_9ZZZZ
MKKIKNFIKEIISTIIMIFIISFVVNYFRAPELDSNKLPLIEKTLLDGSKFTTKDINETIVIHFWATWCRVCKLEISNIEDLSKDTNVITIAVNSGSNEDIKAFMRERGLSFKVINDIDGVLSSKFKIEAFPTTIIYNQNKELSFVEIGYSTTAGLKARVGLSR